MEEKIMLWSGEAPYTKECGNQEQPSLTAFPTSGARGAVVVCPGGDRADVRLQVTQAVAAVVCDFLAMSLIFTFCFGTPVKVALATRAVNAAVNFAMRSLLCILLDMKLFAALRRRGGQYFGSI